MWNSKKYLTIAVIGVGLAVAAVAPASAQCSAYGFGGTHGAAYGGCGAYGAAGYGGFGVPVLFPLPFADARVESGLSFMTRTIR